MFHKQYESTRKLILQTLRTDGDVALAIFKCLLTSPRL